MKDVANQPLPLLSARDPHSHKGDFGRVIVIAGGRGMAGAAALCGLTCLRSGAGLVTIASPASAQPTVAGFSPCYMTVPLPEDDQGRLAEDDLSTLDDLLESADAAAFGPGLGQTEQVRAATDHFYRKRPLPAVIDADGLNALSKLTDDHDDFLEKSAAPRVLTPHPGEFARLTGTQPGNDEEARVAAAGELARRNAKGELIVVLKGYRTVVTDGQQYAVNATGNPGMATGGTGDCLTGLITTLLAQGHPPFTAARLGVHLHGLAGNRAAEKHGETAMIATDLIDALPEAFASMKR